MSVNQLHILFYLLENTDVFFLMFATDHCPVLHCAVQYLILNYTVLRLSYVIFSYNVPFYQLYILHTTLISAPRSTYLPIYLPNYISVYLSICLPICQPISGHLNEIEAMKKHMSNAADRLQNLDRRNLSTHSLASAYHKLATSFMSIVSCVTMSSV